MGREFIADESFVDRTAKVFSNRSLKVIEAFSYYSVPSGTATAAISTTSGVLHAVVFGASAAGSKFWLFDVSGGGSAGAIGNSASALARIEAGTANQTRLFNAIFNGGLTFRLSAADCDGITVIYANAS